MREFNEQDLKRLYRPESRSSKEDNGQVTIIGGSSLFHGAPILALKTASRVVDMVFFSSPEPSVGEVAAQIKSQLSSFIWFPWEQTQEYIKKSDVILIGPGFMRFRKESQEEECKNNKLCDVAGVETKRATEELLKKFPGKQWVIDGGSLQVMSPEFIPQNAILTPNKKEYQMLFGETEATEMAKKYHCIIVAKNAEALVYSPDDSVIVRGGNAGLTKGGTGDVLAGLTVALAAKNPPFLAACAASFVAKKAADELYQKVGFSYSADDLAEKIPEVLGGYFR